MDDPRSERASSRDHLTDRPNDYVNDDMRKGNTQQRQAMAQQRSWTNHQSETRRRELTHPSHGSANAGSHASLRTDRTAHQAASFRSAATRASCRKQMQTSACANTQERANISSELTRTEQQGLANTSKAEMQLTKCLRASHSRGELAL